MKIVTMKLSCCLLVIVLAVTTIAERELEKFIENNQHLIPEENVERMFRGKRGDNSHWCCKNNVNTPLTVQRTKTIQAYKEGYYKVKTGSTNCGTFGWRSCSLYGVRSHQVSYTYTTFFDLDLDKACKSHELTCCHGFVELKLQDGGKNCFALADLDEEQKDLFTRLSKYDGLLGGK